MRLSSMSSQCPLSSVEIRAVRNTATWAYFLHDIVLPYIITTQALGHRPGRVGSASLRGCDPYPPSGARTTGHRPDPYPPSLRANGG